MSDWNASCEASPRKKCSKSVLLGSFYKVKSLASGAKGCGFDPRRAQFLGQMCYPRDFVWTAPESLFLTDAVDAPAQKLETE